MTERGEVKPSFIPFGSFLTASHAPRAARKRGFCPNSRNSPSVMVGGRPDISRVPKYAFCTRGHIRVISSRVRFAGVPTIRLRKSCHSGV